jgi:predicted N-acetyltransferase YhbS
MIHIRKMTGEDIPAGMRLKTLAGWNQVEADWRFFLETSPGGCFVATDDRHVVGTVATLSYGAQPGTRLGTRLGWIGMLLVDPQIRRQGVGTRLMRRAMQHLAGCATIGLDATPLGRPLYEGLGFRPIAGLQRMAIDSAPAKNEPQRGITPVRNPADWTLDRRVFGVVRQGLLQALQARTPALAWQCTRNRQMQGYCLGRRGTDPTQIGPLVAERVEDALALCQAALGACAGEPVLLDVPLSQERFRAYLAHMGFVDRRTFVRMVVGADLPGTLAYQYAIAGPEFG